MDSKLALVGHQRLTLYWYGVSKSETPSPVAWTWLKVCNSRRTAQFTAALGLLTAVNSGNQKDVKELSRVS